MPNWSNRQPKFYIRLPSQGNFWPTNSLERTVTGEYPVYAMTISDEISIKIPDGLINGIATVKLIESCMPNIKNAWHVPSIDLDLILIAIRIATYGELMTLPLDTKDVDVEFEVDLRNIMNNLLTSANWNSAIVFDNVIVHTKPISYRDFTVHAIETFECQKSIQIIEGMEISLDEKVKLFKEVIEKLNFIPLEFISKSIAYIETPEGVVDDLNFIKEYVENIDIDTFEKLQSHIEGLQKNNKIAPVVVNPNQAMLDAGYDETPIEVPLSFDHSLIFRVRLLRLNMEEIENLSKVMEKEVKAMKDEIFRFCWYLRGGLTLTEAYNLTFEDREIIGKLIESNLETTKKSGLPFF